MDLFTADELVVYAGSVDTVAATLNTELATTRIRNVVGRARWATLTTEQAADLKPIALDVAKRLCQNPENLRSESIDDHSVTFATETIGGTGLTQDEIDEIRKVFGLRTGAYSIVPAAPMPYCSRVRTYPAGSSEGG